MVTSPCLTLAHDDARFPAQENVGGDTKIPSVVYYDDTGVPCATGTETLKEGIEADAEEYGWSKAKW
jgi:hypothetical protein